MTGMKTLVRMLATAASIALAATALAAPAHAAPPPAVSLLAAPTTPPPAMSSIRPAGIHAAKGKPVTGRTLSPKSATSLCGSPCFYYAGFKQTVAIDGVGVNASKEAPALDSKAYHSLWELATFDSTGQNLVEVGWTHDSSVCAAGVTICLFIFFWKNGVAQCYNGCGAVNGVGCSPYCMGGSLDGVANGTLKAFQLQHLNNAWWAAYDGAWRFAVPDTAWGTSAFARASSFQSFGEVAASDTTTCADMGAGVTPTGPPTLLGGRDGALVFINGSASPNATTFATAPTRWNSVVANSAPPPVTSIRYGGTGGC